MKTQNSKKKSMTSDKKKVVKEEPVDLLPMNVAFTAIDSGYCKVRRIFYAAVIILVIGIGIALCGRYHVIDMFTMSDGTLGLTHSPRMPKERITLLHQEWQDYLNMTQEVRRLCFMDQRYRQVLNARAWKSPNPANQYIGKEYEQWIVDAFPPRVLNIPGVVNARDMGGWKAEGKKRIRQGLILRCGEFNGASTYGHVGPTFLNMESKRILTQDLKVKTDLDLRSITETAGMTHSPIGEDIRWVKAPFGLYQWIHEDDCKKQFKAIFDLLCQATNYPVAVHCIYGRDRTGTLCYLLEGILGMSDDDKLKDWEISGFWFYDMRYIHMKGIDGLISYLWSKCPGNTLNERCVYYAKSCGVTQEQIDTFRSMMLERDDVP